MNKATFPTIKSLAKISFSIVASSKIDFWSFVFGKLVRMAIFLALILSIFNFIDSIAGFTRSQMLLLYATMNLVDILVQVIFFRGFMIMQEDIVKGTFDFVLTKPVNPLVLVAFKNIDFMDALTLVPSIGILIWAVSGIEPITLAHTLVYILLVANGMMLVLGICLFFAGLTFFSTQIENIWWFYRYGMQVARFPVNIYSAPFRVFFTYILPIAVIVTFPTQSFFGALPVQWIIISCVMGVAWVLFGFWFWNWSLKHYQSASS